VSRMEGTSNFCPAMAVPMTVKMPEPMTAPMPSAVSDHGPRTFSASAGLFRVPDQLIDRLAGKLEPRGVVRLALGAAFFRATRFTFLRSILSSIFFVFATQKTFFQQDAAKCAEVRRREDYGNRDSKPPKAAAARASQQANAFPHPARGRLGPKTPVANSFWSRMKLDAIWKNPACSALATPSLATSSGTHALKPCWRQTR
jgi:hypothetical protein